MKIWRGAGNLFRFRGFRPRLSVAVVLVATVIAGGFAATSAPAVIAGERGSRNDAATLPSRSPEDVAVAPHLVDESPLDTAIRDLFCLDARDAVAKGMVTATQRRWILTNAHRCSDEQLLFDALGF